MAPCRDSSVKLSQLYTLNFSNMSPLPSTNNNGNNEQHVTTNDTITNSAGTMICCYPNGECFNLDATITKDQLKQCVRVICNNKNCAVGQYMHSECFAAWEQALLFQALGGNGRAPRNQNLWTKKGFELVNKFCSCKCGRGQLRKDLDWLTLQNATNNKKCNFAVSQQQHQRFLNSKIILNNPINSAHSDDDDKKRKKKRNRNQQSQQLQQESQQKMALTTLLGNTLVNDVNCHSQVEQQQKHSLHINGADTTGNQNVGIIGSGFSQNNNSSNANFLGIAQSIPKELQHNNQLISPTLRNFLTSSNLNDDNNILGLDLRIRASSMSSGPEDGSGTTSPTSQTSGEISIWKPLHLLQQPQELPILTKAFNVPQEIQNSFQQNCLLRHQNLSNGLSKSILNGIVAPRTTNICSAATLHLKHPQQTSLKKQQLNVYDQQQMVQQKKHKEVEIYSERVRSTSGCNGIFSRRLDFSSFNMLPKTRLNSYQVKIEDEGNHGNDETRLFILSSLAQSQMSRVACILCEEPMLVFDRYPLVDGSFFLSPKQHSSGCIEVKYESRFLYLTCVCMSCLDGTSSSRIISCRFCCEIWDGSNLVLGTMYAYDIFAAMPCCNERIKCNNCSKLLLHPQQRLSFYSDYSHAVTCQHCGTQDTHFVKPLTYCYIKMAPSRNMTIA